VTFGIGDYFRIGNGIAVEHWGVMDTGAMMRQLTGE
jgi:predicted SnoaL-like aldol condensation-catalyzing enzyme